MPSLHKAQGLRWLRRACVAIAISTCAPSAYAAASGTPIGNKIGVTAPTPVARYYGAAIGGFTSLSDMQVSLKKQPGEYTTTDLAVVIRRMDGTFVSGVKFLKAATEVKVQIPANSMVCSVDWRGDKLCGDNVKVCGGPITQTNHYQISMYLLTDVPDPAGNPPALGASFVRKSDAKLLVTKGQGVRGFNPATLEYPLTKNAPYLPPPGNVSDANTCRPGPEPWPEPEPSYNSTTL